MNTAFTVVWGVALVAIAGLLAVLVMSLRSGGRPVPAVHSEPRVDEPINDTLLFYYEPDSVRSTADAEVIVHIPGDAWDALWRLDLLRVEVVEQAPASVTFPPELAQAQALAVYELRVYRMTEMGNDIEVEQFLEPIDIIVTSERNDWKLGLVMQTDSTWTLCPVSEVSPREFGEVKLSVRQRWTAATTSRLGRICLVRLPNEVRPEEETQTDLRTM